jgi:hypothetical protein
MSVSNNAAAVTRIGDGVTTSFPFSFEILSETVVKVSYIVGSSLVPATPSTYTIVLSPDLSGGDIIFTVAPVNGTKIYIFRETDQTQLVSVSPQQAYNPKVTEQVWDKLTFIMQEISAKVARAVLSTPDVDPAGLIADLFGYKTDAEAARDQAQAKADAAAASAAEALAKQNSMLRDRGAWSTGILYSPSDIFTGTGVNAGTSYMTQTSHFATTIAADLAANRIRVFVAKGDAGAGTGDMLKTENLSGLSSTATARGNLGLGALATKASAAFADIDPAAVITDVETLAANKVANAFAVAKAVTDYLDPRGRHPLADKTVAVAAANLNFTEFNNALYKYYEFIIEDFKPVTDSVTFQLLFSTNGGSTYDNAPASYSHAGSGASTSTSFSAANQSDTVINLSVASDVGNAAAESGVSGLLRLLMAYNAAAKTRVRGELTYETVAGNTQVWSIAGRRLLAQDTDAVRFQFSSGNIAVGSRIKMYGYY